MPTYHVGAAFQHTLWLSTYTVSTGSWLYTLFDVQAWVCLVVRPLRYFISIPYIPTKRACFSFLFVWYMLYFLLPTVMLLTNHKPTATPTPPISHRLAGCCRSTCCFLQTNQTYGGSWGALDEFFHPVTLCFFPRFRNPRVLGCFMRHAPYKFTQTCFTVVTCFAVVTCFITACGPSGCLPSQACGQRSVRNQKKTP